LKILLIGDPHLKLSNISLVSQFLNWILEIIEEKKPDMVINLGDTFNDHAVIRSEIAGMFKKHVDDVLDLCRDYRYILGNHDMFKPNDSTYHALIPFKSIKGFTVYDKPFHDSLFSFIPYIHNPSDFPLETKPIAFVHQTFTGANYGGGYLAPDTEVHLEDVSADLIISGHIHGSQWLSDKVFYPGTPFAQSVDDVDQEKGVYLLDSESRSLSFIKSPLPQWKRLTIPSSDLDAQVSFIESNTDSTNVWNLDVCGPRAEVNALIFDPRVEKIRKARNLKFRPKYTNSEKAKQAKIKSKDFKSILNEYVDKIYDGSLDKSKLKDILSELAGSS
jgi:DNA repair exonuclease SbcCD nuclease subunit